jgi:uncharacterized protein YjbI with pentapeptide repeats
LRRANLTNAHLGGAGFASANLSESTLINTYFDKSFLKRTDVRGSNLQNARITQSNFEGAILTGSELNDVFITYTRFEGAVFSNVTMQRAKLLDCDLSCVDFTDADLSESSWESVNTAGVIYSNTIFPKEII